MQSVSGRQRKERKRECEQERKDRSATCLADLTRLQPAREKDRGKDGERAAFRRLPGWPVLKSRGTTITTIAAAAAAAVATLAKNRTFLLSAAAQSSTVLEGVPSVHQGFQTCSGRRPNPLEPWILSRNDLPEGGSASPQDANAKNVAVLTKQHNNSGRLCGIQKTCVYIIQQVKRLQFMSG